MRDEEIIERQIGRKPRGFLEVASRCLLGMPETIVTKPVVPARPGLNTPFEPFPTLFWLTCPGAIQAVSRLEAEGWITKLEAYLAQAPKAQRKYEEAARSYAAFRQALLTEDELKWIKTCRPSWHGVICESGVGGIPQGNKGLKCLHAQYAHYLATGTNPVGRFIRDLLVQAH
jgi:hypothetical protein